MRQAYEEAIRRAWHPLEAAGGVRELVRAGTLAANSHNTQPWCFSVAGAQITIRPDLARRCPAVDPDDHHLLASLGCAAENMVQAGPALGLKAEVSLATASEDRITIAVERGPPSRSALADAITRRQCTRTEYDGRALGTDDLARIAAVGTIGDVDCLLLTEPRRLEAVLDYVVQANTLQMRDRAFMAELMTWIRFNDAMAIEHLDGLAARSTGNPSLPAWLARRLLPLVMTERSESDKYARQVRSSAGIAVFAAASDDKAGWIAAGRACQRFALQATALDIRTAFLNQPVEVPSLRRQLAAYLGIGERRPDLIVRFGRGPTLPPSLRRPIEAVLDQS